MTSEEQLDKVKQGLGITGNYQDATLNLYIADVKEFMLSAGVKQSVVDSEKSIGCITRGVADLWNLGGNVSFSEYFKQRVIQLSMLEEVSASD